MAKALSITEHQLKHMLRVTEKSNVFPARNLAVLYMLYGTGMRLTEIALLPVKNYLLPDGKVRIKSCMPAEIAYNSTERPLYWSNQKVTAALDAYLAHRTEHNHMTTTKKAAFRGLDPDSPIILTDEGKPYKLYARKTSTGAVSRSADALSQLIRGLHSKSGLEGGGAESGPVWFARSLDSKLYDLKSISVLLGHKQMSTTKKLLETDPHRLGKIAAGVI